MCSLVVVAIVSLIDDFRRTPEHGVCGDAGEHFESIGTNAGETCVEIEPISLFELISVAPAANTRNTNRKKIRNKIRKFSWKSYAIEDEFHVSYDQTGEGENSDWKIEWKQRLMRPLKLHSLQFCVELTWMRRCRRRRIRERKRRWEREREIERKKSFIHKFPVTAERRDTLVFWFTRIGASSTRQSQRAIYYCWAHQFVITASSRSLPLLHWCVVKCINQSVGVDMRQMYCVSPQMGCDQLFIYVNWLHKLQRLMCRLLVPHCRFPQCISTLKINTQELRMSMDLRDFDPYFLNRFDFISPFYSFVLFFVVSLFFNSISQLKWHECGIVDSKFKCAHHSLASTHALHTFTHTHRRSTNWAHI